VARLSSLSGQPNATFFWRQLLTRSEATSEDRRHAAEFALGTNQTSFAEEQIRHLLKATPDDMGALELSVQLALKNQEPLAALAFCERLLGKDPEHPFARLNRAQVILLTPDLAQAVATPSPLRDLEATLPKMTDVPRPSVEAARADVRRLADGSSRRVDAFRLLIGDAERRGALDEALSFTRELLAGPGWSFHDQRAELDLLAEAKSPELDSKVSSVLRKSAGELEPTLMLGSWMLAHGRAVQLLETIPYFSTEVRNSQRFKLLRADACASLDRWNQAEVLLQDGPWPALELQRKAGLARALREQHRTSEFAKVWNELVDANAGIWTSLLRLVQLSGSWGWAEEQEKLLCKMMERFPGQEWVPPVLMNLYQNQGRTADLRRLANLLLSRNPRNAVLKNNSAIFSLLLSDQVAKATHLAREAYETEPTNPNFACTYAYGLHRCGDSEAALRLMQTLPPEALARPNTAAYFAALLRTAGDLEHAEQYAALAIKGHLLPEERALLR
jgi:hypothetical protein